jgi:hypothetical protein
MAQADSHDITNLSAALDRGDVDGALEAVGIPRRRFLTGLAVYGARHGNRISGLRCPGRRRSDL